MWSTMDCIHGWKLYLQFIFFAYGVYASRINTALIAVTLILSKRKSRCYVMKLRPYMIFIGFFTPGVLVLIMLMVVKGGFQLLDLIITELKSHMTFEKFKVSHWWKFYLSKKSFTRFALQSECCNFNQWEALNYNRSCDF